MPRSSQISTHHDSVGDYEVEIFDTSHPKHVIVCSHGDGVRRWDGRHFFHLAAEHLANDTVMLVDQNQVEGDTIQLNPFPTLVARVQSLISEAKHRHPGIPIVVLGHSNGCAVASFLDLDGVAAAVFEAPGAGNKYEHLIQRYGAGIINGKTVTTSDNLKKTYPAEFVASVKGYNWEDQYSELLQRFQPVYCFEAGDEEIVGEERLKHRDLPFKSYEIIPGAKHNLEGKALRDFLPRLDKILASL